MNFLDNRFVLLGAPSKDLSEDEELELSDLLVITPFVALGVASKPANNAEYTYTASAYVVILSFAYGLFVISAKDSRYSR